MQGMLENGRIGIRQLVLLFITSRIILTLTYTPAIKDPWANQDFWLACLVSIPITILLAIPFMVLAAKYPKQTIIEYSRTIAGRFAGKVLGLLYIWFFLHQEATVLRQFGELMLTVLMPETPLVVFLIGLAIITAYAVSNGVEVISRFNEMIFPLILVSVFLIFILVTKDMNLHKLTPVLGDGIMPVLAGGFSVATKFIELTWLVMIYPFVKDSEKVNRAIRLGILVCGILFVPLIVMITATYGYPTLRSLAFPALAVARIISIANFLERMESVVLVVWILGVLIKVALFYYAFTLGSAQWLNLTDYKPLVLPAGVILVAMSVLLFANLQELEEFSKPATAIPYSLVFILVIPVILLLIDFVKPQSTKA